jgi:GH18 family chitinase
METDDFLGKCNDGRYPLLKQIYLTMTTFDTTTQMSSTGNPYSTEEPQTSDTTVKAADTTFDAPISSTSLPITPVSDRIIVCYYGSWATYRPDDGKFDIKDIDTSLCTHIIYAYAILNSVTYEMELADPYYDIKKNAYTRFTGPAADNLDLKDFLAIGGWIEGSVK